MKIGYTIWEWGLESEKDLKVALDDIKALECEYFENFIGIADLYFGREDEFNQMISDYGIKFVALYNYISDVEADNVGNAVKYLEFCKNTGVKIMNIQAPDRIEEPTEEHLLKLAKTLNQIGKNAIEYGVTLCLHPHFQSTVEKRAEIDFIAEHTDAENLKFCFDTAHTVLGQMEFEELFKAYKGRIGFVHLKNQTIGLDIDDYRDNWIANETKYQRFFELDDKNIDFTKVLSVLAEIEYDGFLIMENDTPTVNNFEGAKTNFEFLRSII